MANYEFPFNERVRTFMRLEDLFQRVHHNVDCGHDYNHHCALIYLFQIVDIVDRADLKIELIQELDRQKNLMNQYRDSPKISEKVFNTLFDNMSFTVQNLREASNKLGQHIRSDEWLMTIKQRASIPGGVCEFDLPSYHYWLMQSQTIRQQDFVSWLQPFDAAYKAIEMILKMLRGSGATQQMTANQGMYQQMLSGAKPAQMLAIQVDDSLACYPDVSANKYAINIRFNGFTDTHKALGLQNDIPFKLTLCNL